MFALSAKSTRAGEHAVGVAEREPGFDLDIRERHRHRDTAVHRGNAVTATDIRIGRLQRRGKTAPAGEFRGARHVARWVRSVGTSAYIARDPFVGLDVVIGDNVVIDRGAVTCTRAMIGDGARIGRDARVGLDGVVAPGTTVGRGAVVAGTGSCAVAQLDPRSPDLPVHGRLGALRQESVHPIERRHAARMDDLTRGRFTWARTSRRPNWVSGATKGPWQIQACSAAHEASGRNPEGIEKYLPACHRATSSGSQTRVEFRCAAVA